MHRFLIVLIESDEKSQHSIALKFLLSAYIFDANFLIEIVLTIRLADLKLYEFS